MQSVRQNYTSVYLSTDVRPCTSVGKRDSRQDSQGEVARMVMADLYEQYNKLVNFFFPSMKIKPVRKLPLLNRSIISKQRIDAKSIKKYDAANAPYQRLMESSDVNEAVKVELSRRKNGLDLQQFA